MSKKTPSKSSSPRIKLLVVKINQRRCENDLIPLSENEVVELLISVTDLGFFIQDIGTLQRCNKTEVPAV